MTTKYPVGLEPYTPPRRKPRLTVTPLDVVKITETVKVNGKVRVNVVTKSGTPRTITHRG